MSSKETSPGSAAVKATWEVGSSQAVPWTPDTQWKKFDPTDPDATFSRYSLLISCVVPRPIALCSTISSQGIRNCAPFSYFGAISHDPLLISVTICSNGRGNARTKKDTLVNIESNREFVVNIMSEWWVLATFCLDVTWRICGSYLCHCSICCAYRLMFRYLESANYTCGSFPEEVDEIAVSGLNTMPSTKVKPERIAEAAVQMECQVQTILAVREYELTV